MINRYLFQILAMVTMLIDHIGVFFLPDISMLRIIGRLALPAYVYLLYNSFTYKSDIHYFIRLFILAMFSQVSFGVLFSGVYNILFTFIFALICYKVYSIGYIKTSLLMAISCVFLPVDYEVWYIYLMLISFSLKKFWCVLFFIFIQFLYAVITHHDLQVYGSSFVLLLFVPNISIKSLTINKYVWRYFYPFHLFIILIVLVLLKYNM